MGGRGSWRVRGLGFRGVPEIRGTFLGGTCSSDYKMFGTWGPVPQLMEPTM